MPTSNSPPLDPAHAAVAGRNDAIAAAIPVVAETLEVETESVQTGAVRIRIEVERMSERVDTEHVRDEYRPTVTPVGTLAHERRDPYLDGDDVVIPVYEERMVIERRLFLKEEVRLRRIRHVEHEEVEFPVRRDRPVFERRQPDGTWHEVAPGLPVADHSVSPSGPTPPE
jgi:uncharacterized protein (TIGR02271 family)